MAGGPGHGPRRSGKAREPLPAVRRRSDRQRGHRRSLLPGRRCLLVEIAPGEARERVERGRRLRAVRRDEDLVSLTDAEGGQAVEAPAARRTAPAREIDDLDARVEGRCSLNETGGRASVQAERVADVEAERQALLERSRGPDRSGNGGLAGAELCGLSLQPAACLIRHLRERLTESRGNCRGHRSLDERGLAEEHRLALFRRQEVECGLSAQHGAAEIHQHEHAVSRVGPADRLHDANGVGAEGPGLGQPSGELQFHVGAGHLRRELADARRQRFAVGDDHDPDHV